MLRSRETAALTGMVGASSFITVDNDGIERILPKMQASIGRVSGAKPVAAPYVLARFLRIQYMSNSVNKVVAVSAFHSQCKMRKSRSVPEALWIKGKQAW